MPAAREPHAFAPPGPSGRSSLSCGPPAGERASPSVRRASAPGQMSKAVAQLLATVALAAQVSAGFHNRDCYRCAARRPWAAFTIFQQQEMEAYELAGIPILAQPGRQRMAVDGGDVRRPDEPSRARCPIRRGDA